MLTSGIISLLGLGVVFSAPVDKRNRRLSLEMEPCKVSDVKIARFLVSIGVKVPDEPRMSRTVINTLVENKDMFYDAIYSGAHITVTPDGEIEMWQTGPALYMVENEDGSYEQKQATTEPPNIPSRIWQCLQTPSPLK